jgi:hypothetical protein
MGVPLNEETALPLRASSQQQPMGLHAVAVNEEGRASSLVMAEKVHSSVDASLVSKNWWLWAADVRPRPQALHAAEGEHASSTAGAMMHKYRSFGWWG